MLRASSEVGRRVSRAGGLLIPAAEERGHSVSSYPSSFRVTQYQEGKGRAVREREVDSLLRLRFYLHPFTHENVFNSEEKVLTAP